MATINLFFKDNASALLYTFELEGQISDGKYENSRPYDHWKWVCDTKITIDPNCTPGHTGYDWRRRDKKYTLSEWPKYMRSGEDEWAWRTLNFIRFGSCWPSTQENFEMLNMCYIEYMLCYIPYDRVKEDGSEFTYEDFMDRLRKVETAIKEARVRIRANWQKNADDKNDPSIMERFERDIAPAYMEDLRKIKKIMHEFTPERFEQFWSIGTDLKVWKQEHDLMKATVNNRI